MLEFTMKVRFIETRIIKAQGKIVEKFEEGKEYVLPVDSARRWIRRHSAIEVKEKVVKPKPQKPKAELKKEPQIDLDLGLDEAFEKPIKTIIVEKDRK